MSDAKNPLELSDDEFSKTSPSAYETKASGENPEPVAVVEETVVVEAPVEEKVAAPEPVVEEPAKPEPAAPTHAIDPPVDPNAPDDAFAGKPPEPKKSDEAPKADEPKPEDKPEDKKDEPVKAVDHKAFYDKLIGTPIKANGKEITLQNEEEVLRLVQMGAGYGKKVQELQPYLKPIRMLEKNGLLDEGKLSYLIDLSQKNPEAIKQLIKESGLDPLDLNIDASTDYKPSDHRVSDRELSFKTALDEVETLPSGKETLRVINTTWDQQSKSALWESPEILSLIQAQRDNGIYDAISVEIDRQKTLGTIPPQTPFLEAYKIAGDYLVSQQGSQTGTAPTPTPTPASPAEPKVLDVKPATPKVPANTDKARAASPPQPSTKKVETRINPLEMADDEFLKNMKL